MATIFQEAPIAASAYQVWAVLRDVGAVHTRLAPGFVTDCQLEGDMRVVTFANGLQVTEQIVTVDDDRRRLAYAVTDGPPTHHNASFQVVAAGPQRCWLIWIADILPDAITSEIEPMMERGMAVIRQTLDATLDTAALEGALFETPATAGPH